MRRWPVLVAAVLAVGALSGVGVYEHALPQVQGLQKIGWQKIAWQETAWPFPRDGWPAGRAFRCAAALCGDDVELYVRPKIGFCNCDSGVADDDEVDRVADLDLMSERFVPLEPGRVIRIAGMPGRLRSYDLSMSDGSRHAAVGIAVSRRCDLLVAVAQGKGAVSGVQHVALEFLGSDAVTKWMASAMEGR
jgi:hypothetical protein